MFLLESLSTQVKGLLQLDDEKVTDDLEAQIEEYRKVMEKDFVIGQHKQAQRKRRFKPKPNGWDSDVDGHWHAQPEALEELVASPPQATSKSRGGARPTSGVVFSDENEDMLEEEPVAAEPKRAARGARKTAATPAKKAAVAKKAAAPAKKATTRTSKAAARGRKRGNPFEDSDEEEEDVIMEDDDFEPPPPSTRATRGATKNTRQTTLNFASQSQKPARATQKAIEISDDEISEDDDAFETMPATSKRGKRR